MEYSISLDFYNTICAILHLPIFLKSLFIASFIILSIIQCTSMQIRCQ